MGEKAMERRAMDAQLVVRVDGDLNAALAARAEAENIPRRKRSRLYRALLWAGLTGQEVGKLDQVLAELKRLQGNLARIGGNLNQVAYWLNSRQELKESDLLECIKELRPTLNECAGSVREVRDGIIRRSR